MRARRPSAPTPGDAGARAIDELYGLEPVFEPGDQDSAGGSEDSRESEDPGESATGARLEPVECPYCGERFETLLDLSAGSAEYVEDCQVCCRPIEFRIEVDPDGVLSKLELSRGD